MLSLFRHVAKCFLTLPAESVTSPVPRAYLACVHTYCTLRGLALVTTVLHRLLNNCHRLSPPRLLKMPPSSARQVDFHRGNRIVWGRERDRDRDKKGGGKRVSKVRFRDPLRVRPRPFPHLSLVVSLTLFKSDRRCPGSPIVPLSSHFFAPRASSRTRARIMCCTSHRV